jgi:HK97 family phage portal protein
MSDAPSQVGVTSAGRAGQPGGGVATFFRSLADGWRIARELRSSLKAPSDSLLAALGGLPTKSGAAVNENTAFNVSAIWACVNLRASLMAMLPVKVYRKTATGPEELRDHPVARLLRGRVSAAQTRHKWIRFSQVCHDLGGNAFSRVVRDRFADVAEIRWLKPSAVTVVEKPVSGEVAYRIGHGAELPRWEVLHVSGLSTNGLTGRSPIGDLREAIGLALTAEEFAGRSFANGNRRPGVLVGGQAMTEAKAQSFQSFWMQHYAGSANAGKTPFLFGGVDWKDAGFSNADAELLGMRKFSIEEIARVYQIPLHLIGSTDKATTWGSGIEQLNQGLVDYMLGPLCANWEAEMNTTLLTEQEQEQEHYVKFNVDALLRGSPKTRAEVYQILRGLRAITVNEIRGREDMPEASDNGANNLDWPMNNQGGGGTAEPAPATKED